MSILISSYPPSFPAIIKYLFTILAKIGKDYIFVGKASNSFSI